MGLNKDRISGHFFAPPRRATSLLKQIKPASYQILSSQSIGLSVRGDSSCGSKKRFAQRAPPFQTGGGTARLMSKDWVVWTKAQEKFEAGTPAIINIIAFARALRIIKQTGKDIFLNPIAEKLTASELLYHDELQKLFGEDLLNELRKTLIGRDYIVPTTKGISPFINLDNSASTPTFIPIWSAFRKTLRQPESVKQEIIQEVKVICAKMLNAPLSKYDVIFTSNNNRIH